MVRNSNARSLNEFQSADSYLATSLEGNFVGNGGKEARSDVVEGSRVPEVCLMQFHMENQDGRFRRFVNLQEAVTRKPRGLISCYTVFLHCGIDSSPIVWS